MQEKMNNSLEYYNQFGRMAVAPMMAYTHTYFRSLLALIHPQAMLYSEMICADAIVRNENWFEMLKREARQENLVIQLGGSCPKTLAQAVERIEQVGGFSEINLNIGCPSPRVQAGRFGVCLFVEPDLVAECVAAMRANSSRPITVKTRLGVDHTDHYDDLCRFVDVVAAAGCDYFIIHARKAWLKGLNPAQNRSVPPLDYQRVAKLARDFPELSVMVNGGIQYEDLLNGQHQEFVGVMLGRCVYNNPLGMNLATHFMTTDQLMVYRLDVALAYLQEMKKLGYQVVSSKMMMPLVLTLKGFPGARQRRAQWVSWGNACIDIDDLMQQLTAGVAA